MKGRVEEIDWLRGITALWVLSYHANFIITSPKYFGAGTLGSLAEQGHHGVELFFVISGFVMATKMPTSGPRLSNLKGFVLRRLCRIFPAYLAVFVPLAVVGLATGLGAPETGTIAGNLGRNLLLLPRDDPTTYVPVVAWTLTHEMMFYGLVATAFIRPALGVGLLAAWTLACLAYWTLGGAPGGWAMPLSPLNLFFVVGMVLARILPSITLAKPPQIVRKALSLLGQQSFSLYLVHYPVIIASAICLKWAGIGAWALLPVALPLSLAVSRLLYAVVEQPGIALGHALSDYPVHAVVEHGHPIGATGRHG